LPVPNEWRSVEHALEYLSRADSIPRRAEGESALIEEIPAAAKQVLDLGCGDGRLLALVLTARPDAAGVALDFSPPMLERVKERFAGDVRVRFLEHNLDRPLPELGRFDAVVSSFAIHHLEHDRKRELYTEVWRTLNPGGVFANLEHVASSTTRLHRRFFDAIGVPVENEDPSNKLLDVETQLGWLRQIGFADVDCYWKWREFALLIGHKED
jgi:SAM-dependent methyltransferase